MNANLQEKIANYVETTQARLKEVQAEKTAYAKQVPEIVDAMISGGFLAASARDSAVSELVSGGLTKAASVIQFLASTGRQAESLGQPVKQAAATSSRRTSDQQWVEDLLGGN